MEIRAYAINEIGGTAEPFLYERTLGSRDVLVRITHRSLARGDIQFIDNAGVTRGFRWSPAMKSLESSKRPVQRSPTCTPVIVSVSATSRRRFDCSFCTQGIEQLCASQKVIAVDRYGGLAEHIVVDARFAFRLPPQLDSATSTPLLSSGLTVFAGIRRAQLPAGSSSGGARRGRARSPGNPVPSQDGAQRDRVFAFASQERADRAAGRSIRGQLGREAPDGVPGGVRFHPLTLNVAFDLDSFVRMLTPQGSSVWWRRRWSSCR